MAGKSREERIARWLDRIERSPLSPQEFLDKYHPPFSLAQYYRYHSSYKQSGVAGLVDGRSLGNHRRVHAEAEGFILGYVSAQPSVTRKELRKELGKKFGIDITPWGLSRCLERLGIHLHVSKRSSEPPAIWTPYAGIELVTAMAWHFGWPQATAQIIQEAIAGARQSKRFAPPAVEADLRGRNWRGEFTPRYNRRLDVRRGRFESVETKRKAKSLENMDIVKVSPEILSRKCLAVLTLPFVTHNGEIRTVDTAPGKALKGICGFQYKQATLARFLSELKYLGVSQDLLHHQVEFWQGHWKEAFPQEDHLPLLCYYY